MPRRSLPPRDIWLRAIYCRLPGTMSARMHSAELVSEVRQILIHSLLIHSNQGFYPLDVLPGQIIWMLPTAGGRQSTQKRSARPLT